MGTVVVSISGGLALGGTFALVALGIVLAYRATGVFNFAHGQFMLIPAFLAGTWQAHSGASGVVIVVLSVLVSGAISALFYLLVLQRMTGIHGLVPVVATLGLASVLNGIVALAFRSSPYSFHASILPSGTVRVFGVGIATSSIAVTVSTIGLALLVVAALRFTSPGRSIRAAGQDAVLASQSGMNVRALHLGAWVIAGVLAGVAGVAYESTHLVDASIVDLVFAAFPAIMIGGLDSITGALVGGLLVGVFQGFVTAYTDPTWTDVYTYSLLLVVMLILPNGLFGTSKVVRV